MKTIKIDNSSEIEKFRAHLEEENNKRILVTAPFGAGKSFFLADFFASHIQYLPVTLFPGDYSVSSNEDIFELIKYDIIDALLAGYGAKLALTSQDFSNLLLGQQFLAKEMDLMPLFKSIAQTQSLGIDKLLEIFEATKALYQKFSNYREEMNEDEISRLKAFMEPFEHKRGSIRENDGITHLIADLLIRIKSAENSDEREQPIVPQQTILVVDDLDRLEADQIFRLFNIFSAHYDSRQDANKFGFDKVILVCDLDNLEHMFRHRYGQKSSFDGYIDKFYSYNPFLFNQQTFLKQKAREFLLHFETAGADTVSKRQSILSDKRYGQKSMFFETISSLAELLIDQSLLRARNFQKFKAYQFPEAEIRIEDRPFQKRYFPLLVMASMLGQFFPRMADLIGVIDELAFSYPANYEIKKTSGHKNYQAQLITYSLPFLVENFIELYNYRAEDEDHLIEMTNEFGMKFSIVFNVKRNYDYDYTEFIYNKVAKDATLTDKRCREAGVNNPNFYHILSIALKICLRKGYI